MKLIKVLILLFITSSQCWATWDNCGDGPRHHVFLLHGIGGDKSTFGSLPEIINAQDPCTKAYTFEYQTGSSKTTYRFAVDFHQYLVSFPLSEIRSIDRISLVMHSQGGLVGSLWLKLLVEWKSSFLKQLDSFITLSTPFWGADIANLGKRLFYTLPAGVKNPISPFGRNELNEMSYGSATIKDLAQSLDKVFKQAPQLRPLMIGGMKKYFSSKLGEDDVVVPTYSMKADRYYLRDTLNFYDRPMLINSSQFEQSLNGPFVIVSADHIKLGQPGIADVPKECLKNTNCSHPALKSILAHLRGAIVRAPKKYPLSRFRVTMFLNNPSKLKVDEKDLDIKVHGFSKTIRIPLIEKFRPEAGNAKREEGMAFSFAGISERLEVGKILVTVLYKKRPFKTYEVPVEPGVSSFLDVDLASKN